MFFVFSFLVSSRPLRCESPLEWSPVKDATLLHMQVLIRHGARTPGDDFYNSSKTQEWHCDEPGCISPRINPAPIVYPRDYHDAFDKRLMKYQPSCRSKDLLTLGMNQTYDLGRYYRQKLVDELNFLPKKMDPNVFYARATELDRTLRSAIGFIQGIYPSSSPNEIVNLVTDTNAAGVLHPSESWCKELQGELDYYLNTQEWKDYFQKFSNEYQSKLTQVIPEWNTKTVKKFCGWVIPTSCTDHTIPPEVTEQLQEDCAKYQAMYMIGPHATDKYRGIASAPLIREMFRIADNSVAAINSIKFSLLSTHDTAIASIIATLGVNYIDTVAPPFRSHFTFELWDKDGDLYSRFVYNGKPLSIPLLDNQDFFLYSSLKTTLAEKGYLDHCWVEKK